MRSSLPCPTPSSSVVGFKLVALALGLALLGLSPARAADNIGDKLPGQAIRILKELRKSGYKNVGVLNFRVQNGNASESFNVGPLNAIAAHSLENALIMQNSEVKPEIGIIRDAGAVAAEHKEKVSYLKAEGREKLFQYKYPLAWGNQIVEADAFVTGVIKIDPKNKETTVILEVFDRKSEKLREVSRFKVPIERTILADICQSFTLAPDKVRKAGLFDDPVTLATAADKKVADPKAKVIEVEILYNGKPQVPSTHPTRDDAEKVDTPNEDMEVVFVLRNLSKDQKAGVVLAVNGRNTLYGEDITQFPRESLSRWILEPGGSVKVKGVYAKGDSKYNPFKVLSDADSAKMEELDPHPGLGSITLFVFTEGSGEKAGPKDALTLRTASPFGEAKPKTAQEAAEMAGKVLKEPARSAGLISLSEKEVPTKLADDKLKDPQFQAMRVIWFYERSKKPS